MIHSNDAAARLVLEAAEWSRALKHAPDKDLWNAFDRWVAASPAHLRCFLEQSALDDSLHRSGFASQHSVEEWVALGGQGDDEDIELAAAAVTTSHSVRPRPPATWRMPIFALVATVALGLVALFSWRQWWSWEDYAFAETTRPIALRDGSQIQPYTDSVIKVHDVASEREVRLIQGGASFEVHHDPQRAFRVKARKATIEALGTVFNVLIKDERTGVYVAEGRVLLSADENSIALSSGQSADVLASGQIRLVHLAAHGATGGAGDATTRFEKITFGEMAEALNRLNRVPQFAVQGAVRDRAAIAPQRLDDPEKWFRVLSGYDELDVERRGNTVTIRLQGDESP